MRHLFCCFFLFISFGLFSQVQKGNDLDGSNLGDYYGYAVAIDDDGSHMVVGVPYSDDGSSNAGRVIVYSWNGSSWSQVGSAINGEAAGDVFGWGVAIDSDGDVIAVAGPWNDGNGADAGHVRVFSWNGSSWNQMGVDIDGEAAGDYSGYSISMNAAGTRIVIGADDNNGSGTHAGHARIYNWSGSAWSQLGSDIDALYTSGGVGLGTSTSMSDDGTRVVLGAPYYNLNTGVINNSGYTQVLQYSSGSWSTKGNIIYGSDLNEYSGGQVSISGDGNIISVKGGGKIKVYSLSGSTWVQRGATMTEIAGISSAVLDYDGSHIVISSTGDDSAATNAGMLKMYNWTGSAWVRVNDRIDGEAESDYCCTLGIDLDGSHVVAGAYQNDSGGSNAGHVRAFAPYIDSNYSYPSSGTASSLTLSGASSSGSLVVDNVVFDGSTIGHSDDLDLLTLSDGQLVVAGDVTLTSDIKTKDNIEGLEPVLSRVIELEAKKYTMVSDDNSKRKIGLLAQDVQKLFPELVYTNKDGVLSLNYQAIIPVLIKALKEQQKSFERLEKQISLLEPLNN